MIYRVLKIKLYLEEHFVNHTYKYVVHWEVLVGNT